VVIVLLFFSAFLSATLNYIILLIILHSSRAEKCGSVVHDCADADDVDDVDERDGKQLRSKYSVSHHLHTHEKRQGKI